MGNVKETEHATNPHDLEELRKIYHEISTISREELQGKNIIIFCRCTECIWSGW